MRSWTSIITILALVLSIPLVAGNSMAVDFQGREYIEVGNFHAVPFTADDLGIYQFTIDSECGESVAVLILDTANFQKYQANQTFEYEDYTVAIMEKRQIVLLASN